MLILRIRIFLARVELFFLDNLLILPSKVKENLGKKICNDIIKITNDMKQQKIL
jgi:hypothetical protein